MKPEPMTVLVVDDEPANVVFLERLLRKDEGLRLISTQDPREVVELYIQHRPDLILLDLHMPHLDGFEVLEQLRRLELGGDVVPKVVLTADATPEAKHRALSLGARDFLTKPLDALEVLLRVKNHLETRRLYLALQGENTLLSEVVRERTQELDAARLEVLERLARAAEYRDDETGEHVKRVAANAARLAEALGLEFATVDMIHHTAPLHDVGKIGISDLILKKPGKLTPEEFEIVKTHTLIGSGLLAGGRTEMLRVAERIARSHHERWDGSGYPDGLCGEAIPLEARIVSVVDVFDALTSRRPYKQAWPVEEALEEIRRQSGRQFDPRIVEALLSIQKALRVEE
ncbi:HD-GYP domain-containing protein [Calidithermus roseus]|uniref:Cyclic di-GMP phosphodiesterase response regulator RpfG n=1 Tax=Calidithermus roseus TaxID=1644118 RepID=A0A399F3D4_9DEIN|nr:HD domain-containing phosphohydrolase [Calidithermus roseus]RIH89779.1 Cyclic di-GMP phosphodiesterase response regulator RpfG [Calidithermus roseus]